MRTSGVIVVANICTFLTLLISQSVNAAQTMDLSQLLPGNTEACIAFPDSKFSYCNEACSTITLNQQGGPHCAVRVNSYRAALEGVITGTAFTAAAVACGIAAVYPFSMTALSLCTGAAWAATAVDFGAEVYMDTQAGTVLGALTEVSSIGGGLVAASIGVMGARRIRNQAALRNSVTAEKIQESNRGYAIGAAIAFGIMAALKWVDAGLSCDIARRSCAIIDSCFVTTDPDLNKPSCDQIPPPLQLILNEQNPNLFAPTPTPASGFGSRYADAGFWRIPESHLPGHALGFFQIFGQLFGQISQIYGPASGQSVWKMIAPAVAYAAEKAEASLKMRLDNLGDRFDPIMKTAARGMSPKFGTYVSKFNFEKTVSGLDAFGITIPYIAEKLQKNPPGAVIVELVPGLPDFIQDAFLGIDRAAREGKLGIKPGVRRSSASADSGSNNAAVIPPAETPLLGELAPSHLIPDLQGNFDRILDKAQRILTRGSKTTQEQESDETVFHSGDDSIFEIVSKKLGSVQSRVGRVVEKIGLKLPE